MGKGRTSEPQLNVIRSAPNVKPVRLSAKKRCRRGCSGEAFCMIDSRGFLNGSSATPSITADQDMFVPTLIFRSYVTTQYGCSLTLIVVVTLINLFCAPNVADWLAVKVGQTVVLQVQHLSVKGRVPPFNPAENAHCLRSLTCGYLASLCSSPEKARLSANSIGCKYCGPI
jgi:hypothetical protein